MKKLFPLLFLALFFACNNDSTSAETTRETAVQAIIDEKTLEAEAVQSSPATAVDSSANEVAKTEHTSEKVEEVATEKTISAEDKASIAKSEKIEEPMPKKKKVRKRGIPKFDNLTYDFGEIKSGETISHSFKFKNTGNKALNIRGTEASCGCTQPSFPFLPIEVGDGGQIDVTFNSTGKEGKQDATVTVRTDGKPSKLKLHLVGNVLPKE